MKNYRKLALNIQLFNKSNDVTHIDIAEERIYKVMESAPSGSGFDNGTTIDIGKSTKDKLVLNTGFHHLSDNGYYTKWTYHKVIITPSLVSDYNIKITGKDYNMFKDYAYDTFITWLDSEEG